VDSIERKMGITIQSTNNDLQFLNHLESKLNLNFLHYLRASAFQKEKTHLGRQSEDDKTDGQSPAVGISNHFWNNFDRISHTIKHCTIILTFYLVIVFWIFDKMSYTNRREMCRKNAKKYLITYFITSNRYHYLLTIRDKTNDPDHRLFACSHNPGDRLGDSSLCASRRYHQTVSSEIHRVLRDDSWTIAWHTITSLKPPIRCRAVATIPVNSYWSTTACSCRYYSKAAGARVYICCWTTDTVAVRMEESRLDRRTTVTTIGWTMKFRFYGNHFRKTTKPYCFYRTMEAVVACIAQSSESNLGCSKTTLEYWRSILRTV